MIVVRLSPYMLQWKIETNPFGPLLLIPFLNVRRLSFNSARFNSSASVQPLRASSSVTLVKNCSTATYIKSGSKTNELSYSINSIAVHAHPVLCYYRKCGSGSITGGSGLTVTDSIRFTPSIAHATSLSADTASAMWSTRQSLVQKHRVRLSF